jgi:hypothetical protein
VTGRRYRVPAGELTLILPAEGDPRRPQLSAAGGDKGLDPENDKRTRTDFVRRVALALGDMRRKGKVEKIGRGRAMRWKLA